MNQPPKNEAPPAAQANPGSIAWDYSSHEKFVEYYAKASQSEATLKRFTGIRDVVLRVLRSRHRTLETLEVADIGCGAGTQSLLWAEMGHRAHGIDVNLPLIGIARDRAAQAGFQADFQIGPAVQLPWTDSSMDVCLVQELLEHVTDWRSCLKEATRVLKPGGILFLSTTNKLCPRQLEFNLPCYSWYPGPLKRYFEKMAVTKRPDLANYARYPARNWFSFYSLRQELGRLGFLALDRFDVMDLSQKGRVASVSVACIRAVSLLRWLGHIATPGTIVLAVKLE